MLRKRFIKGGSKGGGKKRRKKGEITKLKEKLWQLCREIQIGKYGRRCFSCGKDTEGKNCHLGHFITSAGCSVEVRYDLKNLRPQCYNCNINLNGNWVEYEAALLKEGLVDIEELKRRNKETKGAIYPQEWFECKIREYQQVLNTMIEKKHMGVSGDGEEYVKTPLTPVPDPLELAGYEKRVDTDKPLA